MINSNLKYTFPALYKLDNKGKVRFWEISVEDTIVIVEHGLLEGKTTSSCYTAEPKNIGKANETTAQEQAFLEAEAKHTIQLKSGYSLSIEEAQSNPFKYPMHALNYNKHSDKVKYPCIVEAKANGLRLTIEANGKAMSKSGEPYDLLPHWVDDVQTVLDEQLCSYGKRLGLDCEVWAGLNEDGTNVLELQDIVSAFRKPNENTHLLKLYAFDIPSHKGETDERVGGLAADLASGNIRNIYTLPRIRAYDKYDAEDFYKVCVLYGYEGVVYKNLDGMYEWSKRTSAYIKRKPRETIEALVYGVEEDKNKDGVLSCKLEDGTTFKCLMRKDASATINYRAFENAQELVNKFIVVEYEEFSKAGKPTKPAGIAIREVDEDTWEPKE